MNPYDHKDFDYSQDKVWYAWATFGQEEKDAVLQCLDEQRLGPGKYTFDFEQAVAPLFAKQYGIMVNSGSSALILVAELLHIEPGDEIITCATGFPSTINPFLQKGARVVMVDVDPFSLSPNLDQLEASITGKTKAIVVAHILGATLNMPRLRDIADRYEIKLVEDSCDSLGTTILGKPSGHWSDMSVTSFYPSHVITAGGGGGMLCVNSEEERRRAVILRDWGRAGTDSEDLEERFAAEIDGIPYDAKFVYPEIGYNLKSTEIQAAFGLVQLRKLSEWNAQRRANHKALCEIVQEYGLKPVRPAIEADASWLAFPFYAQNRMKLAKHLEANDIQTRPIFTGNFLRHEAYRSANIRAVSTVNADFVARQGIVIGLHPQVNVERIRAALGAFYG